jgi:hypothetical protein
VTSTASTATVAHSLVKSVITQLQDFSDKWARQFASSAVAYYDAQVASANQDQAKAAADGSRSSQNSASSALSTATAGLSQAQAELNGQNSFTTVSVLDQPTFDAAPTSGLSGPIEKGIGGAVAALLASFLVIVMRTPGGRDRWDDEISDPSLAPPGGIHGQPVFDPAMAGMAYVPVAPQAPTNGATMASATGWPPAPVTPPAPMTPAESNGHSASSSHALRRRALVGRKTVLPQQHDSKPEGGLA